MSFAIAEILGPEEDLTGVPIQEDEAGLELQLALGKARKLKQKKDSSAPEKMVASKVLAQQRSEDEDEEESSTHQGSWNIVLNSTSEFCRALGEIPTYGMAGNREDDDDELLVGEIESIKGIRLAFHVHVSVSRKVVLVRLSVTISMNAIQYPPVETLLDERLIHSRVAHTDATRMRMTVNLGRQ